MIISQEFLHAKNNQNNNKIEFLQSHSLAEADALLEIGMVIVSDILLLNKHLSQTTFLSLEMYCSLPGSL